jgi:cysteine desulfurase/selenocysteine lyase
MVNPVTDTPMLDADAIVGDFPILAPGPSGERVVFLDSAASAQKPVQVLDAMRDAYEHAYANVHRGVYRLAEEATARFERVRGVVAGFLNAPSPREVIFTRGTTEAINLVASSWGRANLGPGDVVVLSQLEHHSNLVPWQQIALQQGATLKYIEVDDHGRLMLDDLDSVIGDGTLKMVSVTHVSNSLGTVNPVEKIVEWAHSHGALCMLDGAQSAPHRPVDVQQLGCDFYVFSGHKLLGPTGAGALWGRAEILDAMQPYQYGGEMIRQVGYSSTTFNDLPWKFEAGTPAIVEVIGMGAAIEYLQNLGMEAVRRHDIELSSYGFEVLSNIEGLTMYGPQRDEERGGILSFGLDRAHPHDVASILDSDNVSIRAGHHCTQPLMCRMGISATARASVYVYNTREDIDRLGASLERVRAMFSRGG